MRIALALVMVGGWQVQPLPVEVSPKDPNVRYVGRWDLRDAAGPRCAWAGSSVSAKFQGSAVNVVLKSTGADHFQIVIDGQPASVVAAEAGKTVYKAASGLPDKEHTIEVFKRTEPLVGQTQFLGFQIPKG